MTHLIAEIGINHDGSYSSAKDLIDHASLSGSNSVKFQYRNLSRSQSMSGNQIGDEILDVEISKNYLPPDLIIRLTKYAKSLGLEVGISFFDKQDIKDFKKDLALFDFFKIPSVEFNNTDLISRLVKTNKKILLSTGCCSETDIEKIAKKYKNENIIFLHCISNYPTAMHNSNLGYIRWLKDKYNFPVGYSSHDENFLTCLVALGVGIDYLERHITIDKKSQGLDHTSSSTQEEFKILSLFCKSMANLHSGNNPRALNQGELLNLQNLGRSFYALKNIKAGNLTKANDFIYRAPRIGIGFSDFSKKIGKKIIKDLNKGDALSLFHFNKLKKASQNSIDFCISNKIGLPARLHDVEILSKEIPVRDFELHFSFGEVLNKFDQFKIDVSKRYSIHLPDYISPTHLIDPFSKNTYVRKLSCQIINNTILLAKKIRDKTKEDVPIVGSFSLHDKNFNKFYINMSELTDLFCSKTDLEIFPQWLPPIAWYFGGSVPLDVFNNNLAIKQIASKNLSICLDLSHMYMCINANFIDLELAKKILINQSKHFHISGAIGIDGEGSDFIGLKGYEKQMVIDCIKNKHRKIIEVWQGHLDGFRGFHGSINDLYNIYSEK